MKLSYLVFTGAFGALLIGCAGRPDAGSSVASPSAARGGTGVGLFSTKAMWTCRPTYSPSWPNSGLWDANPPGADRQKVSTFKIGESFTVVITGIRREEVQGSDLKFEDSRGNTIRPTVLQHSRTISSREGFIDQLTFAGTLAPGTYTAAVAKGSNRLIETRFSITPQ